MRVYQLIFGSLLLMFGLAIQSHAQITYQPPSQARSGTDFEVRFNVTGMSPQDVSEAFIFYRTEAGLTFRSVRVTTSGDGFFGLIPGDDLQGSTLLYYIQVQTITGNRITAPVFRAEAQPYEIPIRQGEPETPTDGTLARIRFRVLSPDPSGSVATDDALIAIALFYEADVAQPSNFRLLLNDIDVTSMAQISPFMVTYAPVGLPLGPHRVELRFDTGTQEISLTQFSFTAIDPNSRLARQMREDASLDGDIELLARNQVNAGNNFDFIRGGLNLRGHEGRFSYAVNGLLTSQESDRLQPQNRFGLMLRYGRIAHLELGHVNPTINPLLMAGRRMYGIHAQLQTPRGEVMVQYLQGQLNRSVNPLFTRIEEQIIEEFTPGGSILRDTTFVLGLTPGGAGTFQQDISAVRVTLGRGRYAKWGLNALRVQDDLNSINYFNGYDPLRMGVYTTQLNADQLQRLADDPDLLNVTPGTIAPVSNFVAATDLDIRLHQNRIQLAADAAVSLLNNDISEGALNRVRADELGYDLDANIENLIDRLTWLIVINENMNALPLRIENDEASLMIPRGIFAWQSRLGLNYFSNNLSVQYRWIGPDFISLANNGVRRDVAGFTVNDRFRLLNNSLYVNLQYERLQDNLINQLAATTYTTTYGSTVSWFPVSRQLPRITVGARYINRDNGEIWENPFTGNAARQSAVRNVRVQTIDGEEISTTLPSPRLQNTLQINTNVSRPIELDFVRNDISVNFNYLNTRDERNTYGDFQNSGVSLSLNSQFVGLPLRTVLAISHNVTGAQSDLTKVRLSGINFGANYAMLSNALQLNAEAAVLRNNSRSFSLVVDDRGTPDTFLDDIFVPDYSTPTRQEQISWIMSAGASYRFLENHQLRLTGSFTNVASRLQQITIPNDHFVQLRYNWYF